MFELNNMSDEEMGFADAYKSAILNPKEEDKSFKKLIIIPILISIILGVGIFIYISSGQKDTTVDDKQDNIEPPKSQMLNNIDELMVEELGSGESDEVDENNTE